MLLIVTILESDSATNSTNYYIELEINGGPIVGRPVDLVCSLDQDFNLSWNDSIAFNRKHGTFSVRILHCNVFNPN